MECPVMMKMKSKSCTVYKETEFIPIELRSVNSLICKF